MKKDWKEKKLGEVCEVLDSKRKPITKRDRTAGEYPYYGATGILDHVHDYIFDEKLILIGEDGAKWGPGENSAFIAEGKYWVNNHAHVIRPNRSIVLDNWIVYFLNFNDLSKYVTGLTVPKLNQEKMRGIILPIPPLSEQKRTVAILDEAFAAIATVKENAEKNLQNARALFESYLDEADADKACLGDLVDITTGKLDANAATECGEYPFFTCSRDIYKIDKYAFDCEAILLAGNNAVGDFNVKHYNGKFNAYQRTYVITVNEKKQVLYRFLYFQMLKSLKKFKDQSVGAGTKFLKLGMIKDMKIALPSLPEQGMIVTNMDSLLEETQHLEVIYQQKLAALEELKKSLLQKAFNGELFGE
ncbi:MAG: restriction endonuclease subunit S [Chloroflexi bacterium]|jgi:type I restriction enzyme S subunit|nr:restriction endonuclease subunit S [Chloroflexota bacterium]